MFNILTSTIDKIIIHRVYPKVKPDEIALTEKFDFIFTFGKAEKSALLDRLAKAFNKSKQFFKLEIEDPDSEGYIKYCDKLNEASEIDFIKNTGFMADLLAISHNKRTIPGGLLLILNGKTEDRKNFVISVKAELQEAFTIMKAGKVSLLKDLFLSPAKDFYKIGVVVESRNPSSGWNSKYSCYMYDDQFYRGKKDLSEYFYRTFLGFTTDRNSKFLSRDYYDKVDSFIDNNVDTYEDIKGLKNALKTLYREDTSGVIDPKAFGDKVLEGELKELYELQVINRFPTPFEKDLALVSIKLKRGKLQLRNSIKIEGPKDLIDDNVTVYNMDDEDDKSKLSLKLKTGYIDQVVTIGTISEEE